MSTPVYAAALFELIIVSFGALVGIAFAAKIYETIVFFCDKKQAERPLRIKRKTSMKRSSLRW